MARMHLKKARTFPESLCYRLIKVCISYIYYALKYPPNLIDKSTVVVDIEYSPKPHWLQHR
jgi:hypothetical protein